MLLMPSVQSCSLFKLFKGDLWTPTEYSKSLFNMVHTLKIIDNSRLKIVVLSDYLQQSEVQKITWVRIFRSIDRCKNSASSSSLVNAPRGKYLLKKSQKKDLVSSYVHILYYSVNIIVLMCSS